MHNRGPLNHKLHRTNITKDILNTYFWSNRLRSNPERICIALEHMIHDQNNQMGKLIPLLALLLQPATPEKHENEQIRVQIFINFYK